MKSKGIGTVVAIAIIVVIAVAAVGGYLVLSGGEAVEEEGEGGEGSSPQENLPSARYLNVSHVPQTAGICYLGCTTMMVKYYDNNIGLNDVITFTGSATGFKDYAGSTTGFEEEDDEDGYGGSDEEGGQRLPLNYGIVLPTTKNLGYTPHIAYTGQPTGFAVSFEQQVGSSNQTQLSSKSDLVDRLKELIASDKPVIAWLDNDSWWNRYFESISGGPEPLVVIGYDENNLYTHVATTDPADENRPVPIDNFSDGWGGQITPIILYLTEDGTKKTDTEILAELKTYAENAPTNLRACADGLENGSISLGAPGSMGLGFNLQQYGALRDNVAIFLREQGLDGAAANYENSSIKFWDAYEIYEDTDGGGTTPSDVADVLREIANLENQAYNIWS